MRTSDKFLLIINPIAGGNDKTELVENVKLFAEQEGVELIEYETNGKNDEQQIAKLYDAHKPKRALVAGGDGTVKMVGEVLAHKDVIFGILPTGSANGLSTDLELPKHPNEYLEVAFRGEPIEMDMVSINGKTSLHLSDLGANAELIKNYEGGKLRGKLGYALQAFTTLKGLGDPFHVNVKSKEEDFTTEARMVVIANSQKYGTGVTINPVGRMNDGRFEVVILKTLDLVLIGKILTGNMPVDDEEHVKIISTEKAVITTNVPVSFQIDGEFCGEEDRLEIHILKNQMRVAVP